MILSSFFSETNDQTQLKKRQLCQIKKGSSWVGTIRTMRHCTHEHSLIYSMCNLKLFEVSNEMI
jgi:hypothetical protein